MPGEVDEKSSHIKYLKEFRTQQCPDFLQHKCSHHRPYNCFNWHFLNQKRRRPFKKDGLFNYNPDVYCSCYDETTGVCIKGDECNLLHRVAGDVERRYHPRYFKTCICVHETDSKGHCVKNGPHCAYAHSTDDLRQPVFDNSDTSPNNSSTNLLASHLEKDILHNEDPAWNNPRYVLTHYKTEQCMRPHRLCRQGYACPSFHNPRDKRRSPQVHKYRSTPCPNVKRGDEWGDPPLCDSGDNCSYCHTRTEQQFHPEIYKSTKCNDMVQTGYCPRGQFCAFAHLEKELSESWDVAVNNDASIADYLEAVLPASTTNTKPSSNEDAPLNNGFPSDLSRKSSLPADSKAFETVNEDVFNPSPVNLSYLNQPEPIGKRRTLSLSEGSSKYQGNHLSTVHEIHPLQMRPGCMSTNASNKDCINQWAYFNSNNNNKNASYIDKILHVNYPPEDTVESVIVNALEDAGDINLKEDSDAALNYVSFGAYFSGASRPVKIPNNNNPNYNGSLINNSGNSCQLMQKDTDLYGRSFSTLPPIGSEQAASMLFDKHIQPTTTSMNDSSMAQHNRINNTFFPTGSLPLSPGFTGQIPVGNMVEGMDVLEVLKNENSMLKLKLSDFQNDREKLLRQVEQLRNERDGAMFKFNSVMNELSMVKNTLENQKMMSPKQNMQQQHHIQQLPGMPSTEANIIYTDPQMPPSEPQVLNQYINQSGEVVSDVPCSFCKQHSDKLVPLSCNKCLTCVNCYKGNYDCFQCVPQSSNS